MNSKAHALVLVLLIQIWTSSLAQQCGRQAGNKVCPNGLCCSEFGYCGNTDPYCGKNCQSQCVGSSPGGQGVASIITNAVFNQFLSSRSNGACPANGFYTYNAFIQAASSFSGFGTTGAADTMKQELAAFFANAAHETSSGCYKEEIDQSDPHCSPSAQWPCNPNKKYYGRGPLQISWNYNYGPAGNVIGFDGINNPEIVATDPVISFKSAIWFWMTPQSPKPSCHNAMVNNQGFGETINIINGGFECGKGSNSAQQDRINLYTSFCQTLGVQPGNNLGC